MKPLDREKLRRNLGESLGVARDFTLGEDSDMGCALAALAGSFAAGVALGFYGDSRIGIGPDTALYSSAALSGIAGANLSFRGRGEPLDFEDFGPGIACGAIGGVLVGAGYLAGSLIRHYA